MKRVLFIIPLLIFCVNTVRAQEYSSPENISFGREIARSRVVSYPTAEEAQIFGSRAATSKYVRPVAKWTRSEEDDAIVFTSKYIVPFSWLSRMVILYVDAASGAYEVYVNDKKVGYTANAFSPAEFDVTKSSKEDANTISIRILKEHFSRKMENFSDNAEAYVGEVYVMSQPMIRVRDVVHKANIDVTGEQANVELGVVVKTESLNPKKARIHYELVAPDTTVVTYGHRDLILGMRSEDTVKFMAKIPSNKMWSAEKPVRYRLNVRTQIEGRYVEYQSHLIGFRAVETDEEGNFSINGVKTELSYCDVDPQSVTEKEIVAARAAKHNALRLKMGAVPHDVYRMCDSLGMYVIAQVPINTKDSGLSRRKGGNPSNDPQWKSAYLDRVETTYRTTCGQACVLGYIMAAESSNGVNLYESYLRLKSLEPTRPIIYGDAANEWNSD
ncbi:MAG: hypothetical protein IIY05_02985 [Alistipes sp.]|nr:hypothetical protein [Alistipes sp.]